MDTSDYACTSARGQHELRREGRSRAWRGMEKLLDRAWVLCGLDPRSRAPPAALDPYARRPAGLPDDGASCHRHGDLVAVPTGGGGDLGRIAGVPVRRCARRRVPRQGRQRDPWPRRQRCTRRVQWARGRVYDRRGASAGRGDGRGVRARRAGVQGGRRRQAFCSQLAGDEAHHHRRARLRTRAVGSVLPSV